MGDNEAIVGLCQYMCPEGEIREYNKAVLHNDKKIGHGGRGRGNLNQQRQRRIREIVKADKEKAVKAYTRPAAGVNKTIPLDLRPPPVLKKTVAYLCTKILVRTDYPFIEVYDFVFDRLRAVRQDMVIQRIGDESAIVILESIIKFHLYAEYKEDSPIFVDALEICIAIQNRNFYKFFLLLDELPPLLSAFVVVQHVPSMRTHALKAISLSYGVKTCKIPLESIQELLCYPNANRTENDMKRIGCQIIQSEESGDKFIKFFKSAPFLMKDNDGIAVDTEVKLTVLCGLNNLEVIATEQICPWGQEVL